MIRSRIRNLPTEGRKCPSSFTGECYDYNHNDNLNSTVDRCFARMALFGWLGTVPSGRTWASCGDPAYPGPVRSHLVQDNYGLILGALSAFIGALSGVACVSFWLASKFNNIYKQLARHELDDANRFNALKMDIAEVRIQAQVATGIKPNR